MAERSGHRSSHPEFGAGGGPGVTPQPSPFSVLRIAWNFVQAKLHRAYPCGRCGYRYDCPGEECHS